MRVSAPHRYRIKVNGELYTMVYFVKDIDLTADTEKDLYTSLKIMNVLQENNTTLT